jgi:osmotically-inducible protein OsmY
MKKSILTSLLVAALAVSMTACTSTPTQSSASEYVEDSVITTKVKALFVEDPTVSALRINVETFKGVVQLSGFANTAQEMHRAVELARGVTGVSKVKNDIRLK